MTPVEQYQRDLNALGIKRRSELATKICSGTLASFDEYKSMCGRLDGIGWVIEQSKELLKHRDEMIDDLEEDDGLSEMPGEATQIRGGA